MLFEELPDFSAPAPEIRPLSITERIDDFEAIWTDLCENCYYPLINKFLDYKQRVSLLVGVQLPEGVHELPNYPFEQKDVWIHGRGGYDVELFISKFSSAEEAESYLIDKIMLIQEQINRLEFITEKLREYIPFLLQTVDVEKSKQNPFYVLVERPL